MLRNSLIREMSFKANFMLWMIVEVLWFCGQIVFFSIIFGQVDQIGDWSKWEVVLLVGTHQMIAQLFQAFFFVNVANVPELVRTGKLDSLLVLPIDSQFAVSTKQFGLDSVLNALLGGGRGYHFAEPTSRDAAAVHDFALSGRARLWRRDPLFDHVNLAAVSFWIVRAQGLVYGYFNFLNIARYPDVIFPRFPLDFRLDHPGSDRGQYSSAAPDQVARATGLADVATDRCAGSIAFLSSRVFWRFALRHYSSASS